jgi:hypothetical protein
VKPGRAWFLLPSGALRSMRELPGVLSDRDSIVALTTMQRAPA